MVEIWISERSVLVQVGILLSPYGDPIIGMRASQSALFVCPCYILKKTRKSFAISSKSVIFANGKDLDSSVVLF